MIRRSTGLRSGRQMAGFCTSRAIASGSVNRWRVPIDEATGKTLGPPEPVTTPAAFVGHFSFSADGTRLAFESRVTDANVRKAMLDLSTETLRGDPTALTSGSRPWVYVD